MFKRIKNFKKNFDDTYDEMQEEKDEDDFYVDAATKQALKEELISETKESFKSFGVFAGMALIFIIVMTVIIFLLKPQISKGIDILMSKLDKLPIEEVKTDPDNPNPDNPNPDNPSPDNPTPNPTPNKLDCSKLYDASYTGNNNGVLEEVNVMSDGSFSRINGDEGFIGTYSISNGNIVANTLDEQTFTFKISGNCKKISHDGITLKYNE